MPRDYVKVAAILKRAGSRRRCVMSMAEGVFSGRVILYLWKDINVFEISASIFTPYSMPNMTSIANYSLHSYYICGSVHRSAPVRSLVFLHSKEIFYYFNSLLVN